jgi:hypothetical protein
VTGDETIRIEHVCARLVARYANLTDAADWPGVAALFAPEGRMARPSAPDAWIVGRAAILAAFAARPARVTRHLCTNIVIDVLSDDAATGECAMALFERDGTPRFGGFHDRFVRTADGWAFAERRGFLTI